MKGLNKDEGRTGFLSAVEAMNDKLEAEKAEIIKQAEGSKKSGESDSGRKGKNWSDDDLQLLIKAVNVFPAGTNKRLVWLLLV